MRKEYDFSKSKRNPYTKELKQQVTMLIDRETVSYFKELYIETGIRYQLFINMFIRDCADAQLRPSLKWIKKDQKKA